MFLKLRLSWDSARGTIQVIGTEPSILVLGLAAHSYNRTTRIGTPPTPPNTLKALSRAIA